MPSTAEATEVHLGRRGGDWLLWVTDVPVCWTAACTLHAGGHWLLPVCTAGLWRLCSALGQPRRGGVVTCGHLPVLCPQGRHLTVPPATSQEGRCWWKALPSLE